MLLQWKKRLLKVNSKTSLLDWIKKSELDNQTSLIDLIKEIQKIEKKKEFGKIHEELSEKRT